MAHLSAITGGLGLTGRKLRHGRRTGADRARRPAGLILAFALLASALVAAVPGAVQAASGPGGRPAASVRGMAAGGQLAGHRLQAAAGNGDRQLECFWTTPNCSSLSPDVAFEIVSVGDTSSCTFSYDVTWGDGGTTSVSFPGGADGAILYTFHHTYSSKPASYSVGIAGSATGGCGAATGTLGYTLLGPPTKNEQGGDKNPSENLINCAAKAPVNCATGVFWHQFTDFSVPGRGVPLDLTRTYVSSAAGTDGPFGHGWTDSYGMSLTASKSGDVTITQEDGSTVAFSPRGSGGFAAPPRVLASLVKNADGGYTFTRNQDQISYGFSSAGRLTSETDLNQYVTRLAYNTRGQLTSVTDPAGRTLAFSYSGARVAAVTGPLGRKWTYGYDTSGDLTRATDPMGRAWSFRYDGRHRLLTITDPRGGKTTSTYNSGGQVVAQTDPDGGTTTWKYSGNPATLAGSSTTMTDPDGNVTTYEYSDLEMVSATRGSGTAGAATTSYTYDPSTLGILDMTDPDGNTTAYTYDANGNLLTSTDALGNTTTRTYNSLNEVTAVTTPLGETTSLSYDAGGNLESVTNPLGNTTTYAYADTHHPGDATSVTDPDGHVTSYTYDKYGDAASVSASPSSGVTDTVRYTYDAAGEPTCVAAPDAVAAGVKCPAAGRPAVAGTTATAYDADGEITSVTDPDGHVTKYGYDPDGDAVTVTSAAGQVTRYAYSGDDQVTTVTRPGGLAQQAAYDRDGQLTSQVNAAGHARKYAYDALGRVISQTSPLGQVTRYAYDPAGNDTRLTDARGQVTTYGYDKDNRLISVTFSGKSTSDVSYAYDADGLRTSMTDATGPTAYGYDADDRLTSVTDGAGQTVSYGYDAAGLPTSLTYPGGSVVTRSYDGAGQLASVTDWLGHTTTFGYDHSGQLTSVAYPNQVRAAYAYDQAGQLRSVTGKKGPATLASFAYSRDRLGQVTRDAEKGAVAGTQNYGYTALSQLASDSAGRYRYDPAGDLTAQPGGLTQAFNAGSELTSTQHGVAETAYAYNADGDLTSVGATSLEVNQANELTGYGQAATYAYNGDGLRMSKTVKGTTTQFAWDQSGSLPLLIAAGSTSYVYGPGGQPVEQVTGTSPQYLLTDQSGSTRLITNSAGAVAGTYTYGPYGAITRHTGQATSALLYDGQYTDAESGYQYLQARYYDPATGQFISADPDVTVTGQPYAYALDSPVNVTDPSGQFALSLLGGAVGGGVGAIFGGLGYGASVLFGNEAFSSQNLRDSIETGFVGGAVGGACLGEIYQIAICGGAGGAAAEYVSELTRLDDPNPCKITGAALSGALGGWATKFLPKVPGSLPSNRLTNVWNQLQNPGSHAQTWYQGASLGGGIGITGGALTNLIAQCLRPCQ